VDVSAIEQAFQRGINGAAFASDSGQASAAAEAAGASPGCGPNEALLRALTRLPGLRDPRAAHETGRALRMIICLFDQAGAPAIVGQQFIDNLSAAVMTDHMRGGAVAWGAADTADMFVEMYVRILGGPSAEHDRVRRAVIDYAVAEAPPPSRAASGLAALFRRLRGTAVASG
jgi:hypothetical protein